MGSCGAALHVKKLVTPEFATGLRRGCKGKGDQGKGITDSPTRTGQVTKVRSRRRTVLRLDQPAIRCWHVLAHQLREVYFLNLSGQAQFFKRPDSVPVDVNLVPFQTVTSRSRMRVVVNVPAFAECQQRNPPTVGREVPGGKAPRSPGVRRRVHQPGGV